MQLILEANNISLSTVQFGEFFRSWKNLIYAKPMEHTRGVKGLNLIVAFNFATGF